MPKPQDRSHHGPAMSSSLAAANEAAIEAWSHPGEAAESAGEQAPIVSEAEAAVFRALIEMIVPPAHYGTMRRWKAGHHRLVVMVYMIAPEYFNGMTREELGRALGLTERPLRAHFAEVRKALEAASRAKIRR